MSVGVWYCNFQAAIAKPQGMAGQARSTGKLSGRFSSSSSIPPFALLHPDAND
jgi:hypothetical protein